MKKQTWKTVSELRAKTTQIISEMEKTREPVVITKRGLPVALIIPMSAGQFEISIKKIGGENEGNIPERKK